MLRNAKTAKILQFSGRSDLFTHDIFVSFVLTASPTHLLINNLKNQIHMTSFRQLLQNLLNDKHKEGSDGSNMSSLLNNHVFNCVAKWSGGFQSAIARKCASV